MLIGARVGKEGVLETTAVPVAPSEGCGGIIVWWSGLPHPGLWEADSTSFYHRAEGWEEAFP